MFNPENVEHSVELPIGTRFYFRDTLLEAAESEDGKAWSLEMRQNCAKL